MAPPAGQSSESPVIRSPGSGDAKAAWDYIRYTTSTDGKFRLWDVASGKLIGSPLPGSDTGGWGTFFPDGRYVAATFWSGVGVVWNVDPAAWSRRACQVAHRNLTRDDRPVEALVRAEPRVARIEAGGRVEAVLEGAPFPDGAPRLEPTEVVARRDDLGRADDGASRGVEDVVAVPVEPTQLGDYVPGYEPIAAVTYDRIPKGTAEIRRSSDVISADGHALGHVAAFVASVSRLTSVASGKQRSLRSAWSGPLSTTSRTLGSFCTIMSVETIQSDR